MRSSLIVPLLAVVLVAGCSEASVTLSSAPAPSTSETTSSLAPPDTTGAANTAAPSELLPPYQLEDLTAIFQPLVTPLGYRISRAALIDRSVYEPTPEGRHLAIYVEPLADISYDQYAADFLPLLRVFLPGAFERWAGLASFDICQEPFEWDQPGDPPSFTLFDTTREAALSTDWDRATIADLVALAAGDPGVSLWAARVVRETAVWSAAESAGA